MLTSAAARGALTRGRISGSSTRVCTRNSKLGSAWSGLGGLRTINARKRCFSQSVPRFSLHLAAAAESKKEGDRRELSTGSASAGDAEEKARPEHAVISTFDLFSIGGTFVLSSPIINDKFRALFSFSTVGPSSSHTVGPMRAGKIFINDLLELDLLDKVI